MVVPGALAGVAVATRALSRPGDRVLVESPTYPNAIATLRRSGARLVGVACRPTRGRRAGRRGPAATLRQVAPRLAYLIPDFHNPTGALMSDAERSSGRALARTRTPAVVDESMAELALDGHEMPAPFARTPPTR